ncbi:hypothetical protein Ancab_005835 [Ancistrocladus abbreviatus]
MEPDFLTVYRTPFARERFITFARDAHQTHITVGHSSEKKAQTHKIQRRKTTDSFSRQSSLIDHGFCYYPTYSLSSNSLLRREMEALKKRRLKKHTIFNFSSHKKFVEQKMRIHKEVRQACQRTEGSLLHYAPLRHYAHLLARIC